MDRALCVSGDLGVMRDQNNSAAFRVQFFQHAKHFFAGTRIERARRFIREDHGRFVHQRTRN